MGTARWQCVVPHRTYFLGLALVPSVRRQAASAHRTVVVLPGTGKPGSSLVRAIGRRPDRFKNGGRQAVWDPGYPFTDFSRYKSYEYFVYRN